MLRLSAAEQPGKNAAASKASGYTAPLKKEERFL
jgi:hypothetical protein